MKADPLARLRRSKSLVERTTLGKNRAHHRRCRAVTHHFGEPDAPSKQRDGSGVGHRAIRAFRHKKDWNAEAWTLEESNLDQWHQPARFGGDLH
jgi:hypothetical protein